MMNRKIELKLDHNATYSLFQKRSIEAGVVANRQITPMSIYSSIMATISEYSWLATHPKMAMSNSIGRLSWNLLRISSSNINICMPYIVYANLGVFFYSLPYLSLPFCNDSSLFNN